MINKTFFSLSLWIEHLPLTAWFCFLSHHCLSLSNIHHTLICPTLASWSSIWLLAVLISWTFCWMASAVAWTCFCMSADVCSRTDSTRARRDRELLFCCSALAMLRSAMFSHCFGVTAKLREGEVKKTYGDLRPNKMCFSSQVCVVHLGRTVLVICRLLMELVVSKAQELSMHCASNFSFRSCSSRYLADRFNLEQKTSFVMLLLATICSDLIFFPGFKTINVSKSKRSAYIWVFIIIPTVVLLSYRICSVICSNTLCRREATPSITSLSFSSSLSTSSCSLSEGRRFILQATEKDHHSTEVICSFIRMYAL